MLQLSRRQITLIVFGALLAATLVVGLYGLVAGPRPTAASAPQAVATLAGEDSGPASARPSPPASTASPAAALLHTSDPIPYARAIATSLFDWDTRTGFAPADYEAAALSDADPSGEETAGLITDVATYLPTTDEWLNLATMDVRQRLVISSAAVPSTWASTLANAHGELRPGTTAVTITGTRHRTGIWNGDAETTSTPVSFTIFIACPPAFDRCHVLRLSQLDNPLR
jgi:hypothetical protein